MSFRKLCRPIAGALLMTFIAGCDQSGEDDTVAAKNESARSIQRGEGARESTSLDSGGGADATSSSVREDAPPIVDPAYLEQVRTQLADLQITADATRSAAATYPDDETLTDIIQRIDRRLPIAQKKIDALAKVSKEPALAELTSEITKLLGDLSEAVGKGAKRAAKLAQLAEQRAARQASGREVDEAGETNEETLPDDGGDEEEPTPADEGDGGGANGG